MTTAGVSAGYRSWAQMVKGKSDDAVVALDPPALAAVEQSPSKTVADVVATPVQHPAVPPGILSATVASKPALAQPLKPGQRGSFQCFCYGKVLTLLSHYGWLETFSDIDHPLSELHMGRIYIQNSDIVDKELKNGDLVSFYLYVDKNGIGAEGCRLGAEGPTDAAPDSKPTEEASGMRADASEFVPGGVSDVFTRMSRAFESIPVNGYVQMVGFNAAYFEQFEDDSSDDDDDAASVDADKESLHDESDSSSVEEPRVGKNVKHEWSEHGCLARMALGKQRPTSPDRSTCAGATSDSSNGITSESENERSCWKIVHGVPQDPRWPPFRPPPGLSLPPGI